MQKIIIYTDGGARGNPGPAAIGVLIGSKEYAEIINETTNNVAEYRAVLFALKKSKHLFGKEKCREIELEICSDSELVVNQLNGLYKIKEDSLKDLFIEIWNLKQDFRNVDFVLVSREDNKKADKLVNQALAHQKLPM